MTTVPEQPGKATAPQRGVTQAGSRALRLVVALVVVALVMIAYTLVLTHGLIVDFLKAHGLL